MNQTAWRRAAATEPGEEPPGNRQETKPAPTEPAPRGRASKEKQGGSNQHLFSLIVSYLHPRGMDYSFVKNFD